MSSVFLTLNLISTSSLLLSHFLKSSSNRYTLTSCDNFQMQAISRVTTANSYLLPLFETAIRYSSGDKQAIEFVTLKLRSEMT